MAMDVASLNSFIGADPSVDGLFIDGVQQPDTATGIVQSPPFIGSGSGFTAWLQQNSGVVYLGAAALFLLAIFGRRR